MTVQNRLSFWPCWPNFGPVVATKWLKMVVSDHFLKYLRNPTQIWCLHLLGDCSELICFLATLAKFWPSSDTKCLKMVVSNHKSEKVLKQSSSNSVSTCISVFPFPLIRPQAGTCIIDLARNGNSGCANEILGCAKCHFWWKSLWKSKNLGNFRVCNWLNCLCKTQVHRWLAKT